MTKKSDAPAIRFKGFSDAWEQRKLGDIADIVGGGTPSTGNQSYWDGDIDWYAPAEIADQIYANSSQKKITALGYENSSAKMLPPGTVLFTSRAGIGKTAILTRKGCTNQGFQSIVPHRGELDSYFIFSRTEELKRYGELVGAGSTFVEVSGKQMAVMELMMPPTMREQQTIGGFFQQLDHLITLHQRQPFLLSTPDISLSVRLIHPFYTSSWEQRKAKELFVSAADKGYPELPVLSATQDRGMIRRDENSINIFHDKKNEAGYKRVLPGQFVIHLRSFQGGFAHSAIEGITSPAYTVFGFSEPEKHDSEYWKYVFTSKSFIQRLVTVTYGIRDGRSISYEEFLTLGFVYPSKAEQTAIARYLDKLSDLITLHQRKGKAAVSGCFLNCFSLEKSSAQSRTLELFGQISNQEIKYIIDGLSILGGKLRNFCVKLIILLSYTRINDIAKYHISRNTECVHNIN